MDPKFDPGFRRRLIAETVNVVDHYAALEVEDNVDATTIKKAYKKLVLKWHPDKHPTDREEAEKRIRGINEAYEVLSNPAKKEAYDQQRHAVNQRRRTGALVQSRICVKTDLPRECNLQPVGYPDKFVRYYKDGRGEGGCVVQSRAEARGQGNDVAWADFAPFFNMTKLSFWWLPGLGNMCRIRADGISVDEFFGQPLKPGQAGGLNFAFRVDEGESPEDSAVKLMEAAREQKKENVNWNVMPSPYYESAFRFEAAYRKGYFLAFRPPAGFRVLPYVDGSGSSCIVDFTIVDFQFVFKFIEIEEVLRLAMGTANSWITLDQLKGDANVLAYFRDVLGMPVWEDEHFQTYFQGHCDTWEFHSEIRSVRYKRTEERLSQGLLTSATPEAVAKSLSAAPTDAVMKLPLAGARHALRVLDGPGSADVSSVLAIMAAKRQLIGALGGIVKALHAWGALPPLSELVGLAADVSKITADPSLTKIRSEALESIVRSLWEQLNSAERRKQRPDLTMSDYAAMVGLPGMAEKGELLVNLMGPALAEARVPEILTVVEAASSSEVHLVTKAAVEAVFTSKAAASAKDAALAIRTLLGKGLAEQQCSEALSRCASHMDTTDLVACVAALAEREAAASSPASLPAAVAALEARGSLQDAAPEALMALAVAATKAEALTPVLGPVAEAAAGSLAALPAADVTRLLLAVSKAKGAGVPPAAKGRLFTEASTLLRPRLPELSPVELVKLGLAAGGEGGRKELLEAVAGEAGKRLGDFQPAQFVLLVQALVPLGGGHECVRRTLDYWASESAGTKDGNLLAKLAQVLASLLPDLEAGCQGRLLDALGTRMLAGRSGLSAQNKEIIKKQLRARTGVGLWRDGAKLKKLERALSRSPSRSSRSSSSRSRSRKR